ncbi:MAG: cation:proton antiporter [Actinobacteria bacterium]|nr:cation:proton antiporter [Actinomycetota bacterium]
MLSSLDEHQLLVFWVQLFTLVAAARGLGAAARKLGQPAVVGELAAGLLLGPSVFGKLWRRGFAWFLPADTVQGGALLAVGWIGVALLLVVTGFETDLGLIRRRGRAAAAVAAGSLMVPFAFGLGTGYLLPRAFLARGTQRGVFALFVATALSISSLPVIAKILAELGLMRRDFGQMTLAAGMANDVVGWLVLGVIAGLAGSGGVSVSSVLVTLAGMAVFLAVAFTVGQRAVDAALRRTRADGGGIGPALSTSLTAAFAAAVATQWLGVEAVFGAFVAGILLGRSRFQQDGVREQIESMTLAVFAPLFFATAGLRVDLGLLRDPTVLGWSAVVLAVASLAKFAGSAAGARLAGLPTREGWALGAALNARGALEIVVATVGLSLGVLNQAAYTAVVLMAVTTSMMAPPLLRMAVRGWQGTEEEQERLKREEVLGRNLVVRPRRVLLPSRGRPGSIVAAQVVHLAWPHDTAATVLSMAGSDEPEPDVRPIVNVLHDRPHEVKRLVGVDDPVAEVVAEAKLGYGVIGIGVAENPPPGRLLSGFVDDLLLASPLPMVVVRRALNLDRPLPAAFSRALIPVSGTKASRAAQEIAYNLAAQLGTDIVLTHVINRAGDSDDVPAAVAAEVTRQAETHAGELSVEARSTIRSGASAADEVLTTAAEEQVDLIVLGATARSVEGRPFLGHMVEDLLERADPTVVVVTMPNEAPG